ncbi:ABC transporter substrate-binding protein [Neoroseomonas oryzicola]|uniref:ABC transporter substrate-binding protein n=1 Tax=Neoroseomonas oryzicola TaxID=535904 RepID=A0A9X9WPF9_9PROT|nr:ABC transporter substrate-binding protein [Neoroseomonas oryzicola]MBR0662219.1 ABC transporter substrate-binding protein [Neoroseomonas oryzicola]NKE16733.1 ABC transporter substrate-binding protein [Neoroseomonas oryzicola]
MFRRTLLVAALAAASLAAPAPAEAQQLTRLNISMQPALYSMLPLHLATEQGWWRQMGIEPNFSSFPAGPPQIAAAAAGTWDVGITGSAPGVLGAARFNIRTIAISNDESATNVLMARRDQVEAIRANPASLRGQRVLITVNTTVDYVLQNCLNRWNIPRADLQVVNLNQAQILSAFSTGEGRLAGLWAPNIYTAEERMNAVPLCSGKDVDAIVPGNVIVREEFLRANPDMVARYLAVFLRGIAFMKANRDQTVQAMNRFYQAGGVTVSEAALRAEIDRRPIFDLDEQIQLMARAGGPSQADRWYEGLSAFLAQVGTVQNPPAPSAYLTDDVLRRIAADARLRAFALGQ